MSKFVKNIIFSLSFAVGVSTALAKDTSTLEFREGERVPLSMILGGDLVEAVDQPVQYVTIKRGFTVKIVDDTFLLSLDGIHFAPMKDMISENLTLTTKEDGGLEIGLQTKLR